MSGRQQVETSGSEEIRCLVTSLGLIMLDCQEMVSIGRNLCSEERGATLRFGLPHGAINHELLMHKAV